jgi:hypothetical protein
MENQTLEPQRTQRSAEEKPFQPQIFTEYHRFKRNQKLREARGRKSEGKPKMAPLQDGTDFEDLAKWHRAADCNFLESPARASQQLFLGSAIPGAFPRGE